MKPQAPSPQPVQGRCDNSGSDSDVWWRGSEAEFAAIRSDRAEIHRRELRMRRTAWHTFGLALLAAISIYSTNAVGALHGPAVTVAMPVSALLLIVTVVWLVDRRLAQQVGDARLHARVWQALVAAVHSGDIDADRLTSAPAGESGIDRLLREEAALAVRFVASDEALVPHLPLLDESIELSRR